MTNKNKMTIKEDIKRRVVYEHVISKDSNSKIIKQELNINGLLEVLWSMYSRIEFLENKLKQENK